MDVSSPIMNVKRSSIEAATMLRSSSHIRCLVGAVAPDVPVWIVRSRVAPLAPRALLYADMLTADNYAGEFWETVASSVLWLCGVVAIVLCLP